MFRRASSTAGPAPSPTEGEASGATVGATVDAADVGRFARLAAEWWNPDGPHAPLHRFVPVRMAVVRAALAPIAPHGATARRPLAGLRVLDVGCGGGLLAFPTARLGAAVTGIDADAEGIAAAEARLEALGEAVPDPAPRFRCAALETLVAEGAAFDAVIASEVVEHVADRPAFVAALAAVLRPGGVLVMTTLNRSAASFAAAIAAAEYVLRWVPRGTHDWRRFVTPDELGAELTAAGFAVEEPIGLSWDPFSTGFRESADTRINYAIVARREG